MSKSQLSKELRTAKDRILALQREAKQPSTQPQAMMSAVEELRTLLEELEVAEEELRQKKEELAVASQALEEERNRYRDLFENAPTSYLVTTPEGVIQEANRAAIDLLRPRSRSIYGKPLALFLASEEIDACFSNLRQLQHDATPREWEVCLRPKQGSSQEPRHVAVSVKAVRAPDGTITGLRWILRDVTQHHRDEERIRALNAHLEERVRKRTLQLESANRAKDRLLELERAARQDAELAQDRLAFLALAESRLAASLDLDRTLRQVADLLLPRLGKVMAIHVREAEGPVRQLTLALIPPGQSHWQLEATPESGPPPAGIFAALESGQAQIWSTLPPELLEGLAPSPAAFATLRDVSLCCGAAWPLRTGGQTWGTLTLLSASPSLLPGSHDLALAEELAQRAAASIQNARLYQELREAARRKDEFLAMLAHELRNPLAPILAALHILDQPTLTDDVPAWAHQVIQRQVLHMSRLVDDLLDVSRITRGKIQLRLELVDLVTVVTRAIETTRTMIDSRRHHLTVDLPSERIRLQADPTRLEQIVTNLLHNAAKYTEPGGRIELRAERQGTQVELHVIDSGIGMAPETLSRVFDLFVQGERSLDRSQGGLGIGLTLVRSLVEMHGGTVRARSPGLGQGSEFVVTLPLPAPEVPAPEPAPSAPRNEPAIRLRVLVVDDNVDAARSLALLLRLWGHEVRLAHSGPDALRLARDLRPNVILLDIGLPNMDGYAVAQAIQQDPALASAALVALTGYGQAHDRERSRQSGFCRHLVKPVDPAVIQALLQELAEPEMP